LFIFILLGDIAVDDIAWSPNITCPAGGLTTTTIEPVIPTTYRKNKSSKNKKQFIDLFFFV